MERTTRIVYLAERLCDGLQVRIKDVARHFELSEKTIKRDIEYMRDFLAAPVVWDSARHTYALSKPWDRLRFMNEESLLALAFLKAIMREFKYLPILADEVAEQFSSRIPDEYVGLVDRIHYELPYIERAPNEAVRDICHALRDKQSISIEYTKASGDASARIIEPLHLINYTGKWYCLAWDRKSNELRLFALGRMHIISVNSGVYENICSEEEVQRELTSSYGIFSGKVKEDAVLWFYGGAARAVASQIWHRDQCLRKFEHPTQGPALELTLPVSNYTELLGRALRCGCLCEVRESSSFRADWQAEIRKMAELAGM